MQNTRKKLIVVLGMHRSGTSAATRALKTLGVNLGDHLMPADKDANAKGYWEDLDLYELNNEMLHSINSDWHHISPLSRYDINQLVDDYAQRAMNLLDEKLTSTDIFGFKDPRSAKLAAFWESVFDKSNFDIKYLVVIRNPISVAESLSKRDGFHREKSYFLWLDYVVSSLTFSKENDRIIVDYDLLMEDPDLEIRRIAKFFDLNIRQEEFEEYKTDFLDKSLRHSIFGSRDIEVNDSCPPIIQEIYPYLKKIASDDAPSHYSEFHDKLGRWSHELARIKNALILIDKLHEENAKTTISFENIKTELNDLMDSIKDKDMEITKLKNFIDFQNKRIDSLKSTISEQNIIIKRLNHQTTEHKAKIGILNKQLSEAQNTDLWKQSKNLQHQVTDLLNSRSWRLTAPLRFVANTIRFYNLKLRQTSMTVARNSYQHLPMSSAQRHRIKAWLYQRFPHLLSRTPFTNTPGTQISSTMPDTDLMALTDVSEGDIELAQPHNPLISIIIPVYGNISYTYRCLRSLSLYNSKFSFEVIVVDDCSPDNTQTTLQSIKGIRLLSNPENRGFIFSCNKGASHAKGKFLVMLNNDTVVRSGWLDELVQTFHEFPGTGLVGSKLIYPDGSLQEAGGIIWEDGSAWNFGKLKDPLSPEYNYAREVDYCSGASIMVPKDLFENLGGFDEHYAPAYCEDSDLALKIRNEGYRVIYQPLSSVVHFEGITSGTDVSQGIKSYQIENTRKLFTRWKHLLNTHEVPGTNIDNAKDRRAKKRVLVIDHCTPAPNQDAGSVTAFNLMLLLREMDFQVTFIPEDNFLYISDYTPILQRSGIEALYAPYVTSVKQHLKAYGKRYDLVFLFRPAVFERHEKTIRLHCPTAKLLYHTIDLHFIRLSREAELEPTKTKVIAAKKMESIELAAIHSCDAAIVHSTAELDILRPIVPANNLHVFPLIIDVTGTNSGYSDRKDIVFVGGYQHKPNVDAVQYFATDIMPILRQKISGIRLYIVGSNPPTEIFDLEAEDIIITGFVKELTPLLDKIRIAIAPLRYGAGIKGKIGTTMAAGLPVVATSIATEGMSLTDGENITVADGAEAFSDAIEKIYNNEQLWCHLSQNGIACAKRLWGSEAAWNTLATILQNLDIDVPNPPYALSLYSEKPISEAYFDDYKYDISISG